MKLLLRRTFVLLSVYSAFNSQYIQHHNEFQTTGLRFAEWHYRMYK